MTLRAVAQGGGTGGGQTPIQFQDEGIALGAVGTVDTIDFTGAGVAASRIGNTVTVNVGGGGGGAPAGASYLTLGLNGSLTNERVLTAGTNVSFVDLGPDSTLTVNVAGTDLTYTAGTRTLNSSTGADVVLPLFNATDAGLVPLSGGGTANFLRADGTFALPPGGGTGLTHPQVMARAQFAGAF